MPKIVLQETARGSFFGVTMDLKITMKNLGGI